jgi:hypothetical protein
MKDWEPARHMRLHARIGGPPMQHDAIHVSTYRRLIHIAH